MDRDTDWQNVDDISKTNMMMLDKQLACDVYFLIGEEPRKQGAHKFILISRSPVFEAMICRPLTCSNNSDQNECTSSDQIKIEDIEPEIFQDLLR